jgi:hypothetical protein
VRPPRSRPSPQPPAVTRMPLASKNHENQRGLTSSRTWRNPEKPGKPAGSRAGNPRQNPASLGENGRHAVPRISTDRQGSIRDAQRSPGRHVARCGVEPERPAPYVVIEGTLYVQCVRRAEHGCGGVGTGSFGAIRARPRGRRARQRETQWNQNGEVRRSTRPRGRPEESERERLYTRAREAGEVKVWAEDAPR